MLDLTGRIINDYEIRGRIGTGGFSIVYYARHQKTGRDVAIKHIQQKYAFMDKLIQRFEQEVQVVSQLKHPHIVRLFDYWRDGDGMYLIMEWIRGGSLRDLLEERGVLSVVKTARMLDQLADALHTAHKAGIIHRDLKPDNILFDWDGNAYISDFGIAKDTNRAESITGTDSIIGSRAYAAPEQIIKDEITPRTDIYTLGLTLYESLIGEHPYGTVGQYQWMNKLLREALPPLHEKRPILTPAIDRVIQKATAKVPANRYATVLEMAADFNQAVNLVGTL